MEDFPKFRKSSSRSESTIFRWRSQEHSRYAENRYKALQWPMRQSDLDEYYPLSNYRHDELSIDLRNRLDKQYRWKWWVHVLSNPRRSGCKNRQSNKPIALGSWWRLAHRVSLGAFCRYRHRKFFFERPNLFQSDWRAWRCYQQWVGSQSDVGLEKWTSRFVKERRKRSTCCQLSFVS